MYSFHASASAYTEFWNNSYSNVPTNGFKRISRRQTWQAFVQESICSISAESNVNLVLQDGLAIDDVTKEAFSSLGENGIICAANNHECDECAQPYKHTSDVMPGANPTAMVDVDGAMDIDEATDTYNMPVAEAMNIDNPLVKMIVVDGIVMGPTVSILYLMYDYN